MFHQSVSEKYKMRRTHDPYGGVPHDRLQLLGGRSLSAVSADTKIRSYCTFLKMGINKLYLYLWMHKLYHRIASDVELLFPLFSLSPL